MSWKDEFDSWILKKGRDYFEEDAVDYINKDNNVYIASVHGSSNYKVNISINNKGELITASCTCPYFRQNRDYCKHIAAVMFEIENIFPDTFVPKPKFKEMFHFKKNPDLYIDMEKVTNKLIMNQSDYLKAKNFIESGKCRMINCYPTFDYQQNKELDFSFRVDDENVYLDITRNEVLRLSCYCRYSLAHGYSDTKYPLCEHRIAALLLAENFFKAHEVDDTNQSGIILLESLKNYKEKDNESVRRQCLHIFPVIEFDTFGYACTLKIKIGENRGVMAKDLYSLVETYNKKGVLTLSTKSVYDFNEVDFVDEDKPIFKYIEDLTNEYNAFYAELADRNVHNRGGSSFIKLKQTRLDKVFDLLYGREIEYIYKEGRDKDKSLIKLSIMNSDLPISIENEYVNDKFDGIIIKHQDFDFLQGNKYKYVVKQYSFSRLLCDNPIVDNLYSAGSNIKIGKTSLANFYYDYLPKLKQYPNLLIEDEKDIIENIPVRPTFKFYLDNIDGLVSVHTKVNYKDKEYSLLSMDDSLDRDSAREKEIYELLKEYFDFDDTNEAYIKDDDALYDLLTSGLNRLRQVGEVFSTDRFDRLKNKKKVKFSIGVSVKSELLNLSLMSDLSQSELLNVLSSYKQKKKFHRLSNGDFIDMNDSDLNKLLSLKEEMNITDKKFLKGEIKLPTYRVLSLNEELNEFENIDLKRDKNFKEFVERFQQVDMASYKVSDKLNAKLRPYQTYGFKWLNVLYDCGFGGILADEMGLGKTLQIISLLQYRKSIGEKILSLIITPASLVYNWYAEFNKFAQDVKVGMLTGNKNERSDLLKNKDDYDVLITSYDLLKRDIDLYDDISFDFEVIDEAQYIKNQSTGAARAVKQIVSKKRFALTGTPIENRLSELWSIFDYLMPDYLYSYDYFKKHFESKIVNEKDEDASLSLKKMIGPFILRRRKLDVLKDLPDKIERVYYANFEKSQKEIYDAQIMKISRLVENQDESAFSKSKIAILAELTKTRQICCDPSLLLDNYNGGSAKKDTCLELIEESIEGGHKMLIFSQFTSMLELLEEKLNEKEIKYYKITGSTDKKERLELCNKFNNDDVPVFLISLKAGGTGLNLIGADIVIHYDPWWNEAVISQATDRTHRIGQKNTVTVYKLIAKGTIEEKILKLQEEKKNLADEILSGANTNLTSLSKDELLDLLKGE